MLLKLLESPSVKEVSSDGCLVEQFPSSFASFSRLVETDPRYTNPVDPARRGVIL